MNGEEKKHDHKYYVAYVTIIGFYCFFEQVLTILKIYIKKNCKMLFDITGI